MGQQLRQYRGAAQGRTRRALGGPSGPASEAHAGAWWCNSTATSTTTRSSLSSTCLTPLISSSSVSQITTSRTPSGSSLLSLAINSAVVMDPPASPAEPVIIREVILRAYQQI